MKIRYFILSLLILSFGLCKAQDTLNNSLASTELYFTAGKVFSTFQFTDGAMGADSNLSFNQGQTFGLGFVFNLNKRHQIRPEIHYSEMGAKSMFLDSRVNWRLNYLGIHFGYLFRVFEKNRVSISPGVVFGADYLVAGEQTIGDVRLDVKKEDSFEPVDLNLGLLLNLKVKVTDSFSLFFDYRGQWGLLQIENIDLSETTKNIGHRIMFGASFKL